MNIFFGIAGKPFPGEIEKTQKRLESIYGITCRLIDGGKAGFALFTQDSILNGAAQKNSLQLTLHGVVHHPVVEWENTKSPLDDISVTASHLLNLWEKYGTATPGMASGSFAGCLLDKCTGSTFIFSDPESMRTLYIYQKDNRIWFASNPRLLATIIPEIKIDRRFEDFFLIYGFWPDGKTAYKGITALPAGLVMEVTLNSVKTHTVERVSAKKFPFRNPDFDGADFDKSLDILYSSFMQAIKDQTAGEKKAAVLLGGVDSALVASCLKRLGKQVETFSFYYDIESFNQPHTDTLSDYLGTTHTWVPITPDIMIDGHKNWALRYSQPSNWANYVIQTSHLCRVIREKGIKRCYSGDGCDGTFLGYPNVHRRSAIYKKTKKIPEWILSLIFMPMQYAIFEYVLSRIYTVSLSALRSFGRTWPARGFLTFRVMDEFSLPRLRKGFPPLQEKPPEDVLNEIADEFAHFSPDRLAYMGKNMVSPNKAKMNGCMDNENLSVLSPYLHPELKKMAQNIPDEFLRPEGLDKKHKNLGKYVLLKMIQKYRLLPDEVIFQPKIAAVDAPVDAWYTQELRNEILLIIKGMPFETNQNYVKFLLKNHPANRLYTRYFCSDSVTSHAISLLATYASYTQDFQTDD